MWCHTWSFAEFLSGSRFIRDYLTVRPRVESVSIPSEAVEKDVFQAVHLGRVRDDRHVLIIQDHQKQATIVLNIFLTPKDEKECEANQQSQRTRKDNNRANRDLNERRRFWSISTNTVPILYHSQLLAPECPTPIPPAAFK